MGNGIVSIQLVYWAQIAAAGTLTVQNGPGLLTCGNVSSVYTITMPANYTIPVNRRLVVLTVNSATLGQSIQYDEAASASNTVVCKGAAFGGGAADCGFQIGIYRVEMLP